MQGFNGKAAFTDFLLFTLFPLGVAMILNRLLLGLNVCILKGLRVSAYVALPIVLCSPSLLHFTKLVL